MDVLRAYRPARRFNERLRQRNRDIIVSELPSVNLCVHDRTDEPLGNLAWE
ncbi:MAG: hypothetical protein ACPGU7_05310 [Gammaproteobacteria bacterium]